MTKVKNKKLFYVIAMLSFVFVLPLSCRKHKISQFSGRIIGVWNMHFPSGGHLVAGGGTSQDEYYSEDGKWIAVYPSVCFTDQTCENFTLCSGNQVWITDTLPYRLEDDLLIRVRHQILYDKTSPLVTDTFKIIKIYKCMLSKGSKIVLEAKNNVAADYFGKNIGDKFEGYKRVYNKEAKACDAPTCGI